MDNDMTKLARQLQGFEAVWRRVGANKTASAAAEKRGLRLMPEKNRRGGSARFAPGHNTKI